MGSNAEMLQMTESEKFALKQGEEQLNTYETHMFKGQFDQGEYSQGQSLIDYYEQKGAKLTKEEKEALLNSPVPAPKFTPISEEAYRGKNSCGKSSYRKKVKNYYKQRNDFRLKRLDGDADRGRMAYNDAIYNIEQRIQADQEYLKSWNEETEDEKIAREKGFYENHAITFEVPTVKMETEDIPAMKEIDKNLNEQVFSLSDAEKTKITAKSEDQRTDDEKRFLEFEQNLKEWASSQKKMKVWYDKMTRLLAEGVEVSNENAERIEKELGLSDVENFQPKNASLRYKKFPNVQRLWNKINRYLNGTPMAGVMSQKDSVFWEIYNKCSPEMKKKMNNITTKFDAVSGYNKWDLVFIPFFEKAAEESKRIEEAEKNKEQEQKEQQVDEQQVEEQQIEEQQVVEQQVEEQQVVEQQIEEQQEALGQQEEKEAEKEERDPWDAAMEDDVFAPIDKILQEKTGEKVNFRIKARDDWDLYHLEYRREAIDVEGNVENSAIFKLGVYLNMVAEEDKKTKQWHDKMLKALGDGSDISDEAAERIEKELGLDTLNIPVLEDHISNAGKYRGALRLADKLNVYMNNIDGGGDLLYKCAKKELQSLPYRCRSEETKKFIEKVKADYDNLSQIDKNVHLETPFMKKVNEVKLKLIQEEEAKKEKEEAKQAKEDKKQRDKIKKQLDSKIFSKLEEELKSIKEKAPEERTKDEQAFIDFESKLKEWSESATGLKVWGDKMDELLSNTEDVSNEAAFEIEKKLGIKDVKLRYLDVDEDYNRECYGAMELYQRIKKYESDKKNYAADAACIRLIARAGDETKEKMRGYFKEFKNITSYKDYSKEPFFEEAIKKSKLLNEKWEKEVHDKCVTEQSEEEWKQENAQRMEELSKIKEKIESLEVTAPDSDELIKAKRQITYMKETLAIEIKKAGEVKDEYRKMVNNARRPDEDMIKARDNAVARHDRLHTLGMFYE